MSDERQVPGPADSSDARIRGRPYDSDFARLPREEVQIVDQAGAGPAGSRSMAARSQPAVVIFVGFLLAFSTFLINTPIMFFVGLAVMVGGFVWARRVHPRYGARQGGLGPATFDNRDASG